MKKLSSEPRLKTAGIGCFILLFVLFLNNIISAQSFDAIKLQVPPYREFPEGYYASKPDRDEHFSQKIPDNRPARTIKASITGSIHIKSVRMVTSRGAKCSNQWMRLIPASAASFMWTLKRSDTVLNKFVTLVEISHKLKAWSRPTGSRCLPVFPRGTKSIEPEECNINFYVPISSAQLGNTVTQYAVQFDIMDKNKNIIFSRTEMVPVPKKPTIGTISVTR